MIDNTVVENNSEVKFIPPKRKGLSVKTKRLIFVWAMLAYPIIQFLIFFVYVNIDSVLMSLDRLKPNKITGVPESTFPTFYYYDKFFKDGDEERNTLTEFNSNNTKRLTLEETKAKIASLQYIQEELAGIHHE